ncbi:MAG TPA: response regulator [Alphaproteobacteria bacterium]|jgi:CheY-like chemotaxis protein|nr:response regulator [Alphaproteobacteria bacterium]
MTDAASRILVVDDDDSGRYLKSHILRRAGHLVIEAGNGRDALRTIAEEKPALVVLDIKLPDINGIEVCRQIKAADPSVLVLQTSAAFVGKKDRARGLVGGADSFLIEPIEVEELTATVEALLRLHRAEQSLRRANEALEERVAERTREISEINQRLVEEMRQRAEAEEIARHVQKLEALGQLTGGISHDFNNLLTIITGNLESLRREMAKCMPDADRLRRLSDNAFHGAQRAVGVTQRLLAFSRRQSLRSVAIEANGFVRGMNDLLRQTLGERISVRIRTASTPLVVQSDPSQLESAILNLVINARDAMPAGGEVSISVESPDGGNAASAGGRVAISVADNGSGMPPHVLKYAFEPFFTTKDVGHGTGLGLSQVYGFVRQSGGDVTIDSTVGAGTTVRIVLPQADVPAAMLGESEIAVDRVTMNESITVLVVEDNEQVREHSVDLLTELGYRVLQASNGNEALSILDAEPANLLFTDVGLPGGMSGERLAEEAQRRHPGLKVLYTTGYDRTIAAESAALGLASILPKPFTFAALSDAVSKVLRSGNEGQLILVVDDESLIREGVVEMLHDLGFETEEAGSSEEALRKVEKGGRRIDGAIVDIGLPDRRGDVLADEIRRVKGEMPIIIATGYSERSVTSGRGKGPRIAFLQKPFYSEDMETALKAVGLMH